MKLTTAARNNQEYLWLLLGDAGIAGLIFFKVSVLSHTCFSILTPAVARDFQASSSAHSLQAGLEFSDGTWQVKGLP
ncbi:hypothetical protein [Paracoccus saliphilus]|uniref:Uncharacterized protein n=1 Tax=Paracoccus saliphilus TaxID=405559 RepID=A0ABY7S312_9RHOB|nr:hypothetical protein [Paracoccus saliphilus]WCR01454.1 hypothetical protein JHX88_10860 [Paracoccus saliphilus]